MFVSHVGRNIEGRLHQEQEVDDGGGHGVSWKPTNIPVFWVHISEKIPLKELKNLQRHRLILLSSRNLFLGFFLSFFSNSFLGS